MKYDYSNKVPQALKVILKMPHPYLFMIMFFMMTLIQSTSCSSIIPEPYISSKSSYLRSEDIKSLKSKGWMREKSSSFADYLFKNNNLHVLYFKSYCYNAKLSHREIFDEHSPDDSFELLFVNQLKSKKFRQIHAIKNNNHISLFQKIEDSCLLETVLISQEPHHNCALKDNLSDLPYLHDEEVFCFKFEANTR